MPTPTELTEIAVRHGRGKKRKNAIAALLCSVIPAVLLSFYSRPVSWKLWPLGFIVGLIVGLIWGDAFEYVYHRWLLHRPRSPLGTEHHQHHVQIGTPEQAEHVALISSPLKHSSPVRHQRRSSISGCIPAGLPRESWLDFEKNGRDCSPGRFC